MQAGGQIDSYEMLQPRRWTEGTAPAWCKMMHTSPEISDLGSCGMKVRMCHVVLLQT
jgi:hypothetical protein